MKRRCSATRKRLRHFLHCILASSSATSTDKHTAAHALTCMKPNALGLSVGVISRPKRRDRVWLTPKKEKI